MPSADEKIITATERRLAGRVGKWGVLRPGEAAVELKVGEWVSHKIDGVPQAIKAGGLGRLSLSRSGSCCGYSQTVFFVYGAGRAFTADLGLLTPPQLRDGSLIEFAAFVPRDPPVAGKTSIVTIRWRIEDVAAAMGFVARLDAARVARRQMLPADLQEWILPRDEAMLSDEPLD